MTDRKCLITACERLIAHGEPENAEYMHHLRSLIANLPCNRATMTIVSPCSTLEQQKKQPAMAECDGCECLVSSDDLKQMPTIPAEFYCSECRKTSGYTEEERVAAVTSLRIRLGGCGNGHHGVFCKCASKEPPK